MSWRILGQSGSNSNFLGCLTRDLPLRQIHSAVDVEDVAGDVGGFVAGEENDGGGDVLASAHASERNAYLQFFLHFVGKDGGHGRLDETWGHGVNSDIARRNFNGDGLGEADDTGLRCNV